VIEYLMLSCGLISGALIYLALQESIEEHMNIRLTKNLFFPLFILIVLVGGVYVAQSIQLGERAAMNSDAQRKVSIYGCILEDTGACDTLVNQMNNDNYAAFTAGKTPTVNLFIGFSLRDVLIRNVFTYFCIGILFLWGSVFLYSLKKVEQ